MNVVSDCHLTFENLNSVCYCNYREAKLHGSKRLPDALPDCPQIATVQSNSNGTRISIIVEQVWQRSNGYIYSKDIRYCVSMPKVLTGILL